MNAWMSQQQLVYNWKQCRSDTYEPFGWQWSRWARSQNVSGTLREWETVKHHRQYLFDYWIALPMPKGIWNLFANVIQHFERLVLYFVWGIWKIAKRERERSLSFGWMSFKWFAFNGNRNTHTQYRDLLPKKYVIYFDYVTFIYKYWHAIRLIFVLLIPRAQYSVSRNFICLPPYFFIFISIYLSIFYLYLWPPTRFYILTLMFGPSYLFLLMVCDKCRFVLPKWNVHQGWISFGVKYVKRW